MAIRQTQQHRQTSFEIRDRIELILNRLRHVIESPADKPAAIAELKEVAQLFECLPLSSFEFELAIRRLQNGVRYLQSDEYGAAQFELRLLASSFRSN